MLKLAALFGDNAVLQQGKTIPVWGWTTPCAMVKGKLGEHEAETRAAASGRFTLRFPAMTARHNLELFVLNTAGGESCVSHNLAVGEVWIASGQSNMEFKVRSLADRGEGLRRLADAGELDRVRMITVARNARWEGMEDVEGAWQQPSAETVDDWSAAALFFALKVSHKLGVPVGIVSSSWGGTMAEAWSSREILAANPAFTGDLESFELKMSSPGFWGTFSPEELADPEFGKPEPLLEQKAYAEFLPPEPPNSGFEQGWANSAFDDSTWDAAAMPAQWINFGIATNGTVYYRRKVEIPAEWAGRPLVLSLGAVDKHDITYFDGVEIGRSGANFDTSFWDQCRVYRIPAGLAKPGTRVIAVRDYSFIYDGGLIGPAAKMLLYPEGMEESAISLAGEWRYRIENDLGSAIAVALPGAGNPKSPAILFENMIAPLIPMALRGVIWYQGESNSANVTLYETLMTNLITDWRYRFRQGNFPFLQVVLAGYRTPQNYDENAIWPLLREAQIRAAANTGNFVASATDAGEAEDIHPKDKKTVGERLAIAALSQCYGNDEEASGPLFKAHTQEGKRLRISFTHAEGLHAENNTPKCFRIAGKDGNFLPATAEIDGNDIILANPDIPNPVHARYAWSDNPENANVYNGADLPMLPFRTDS